jgi:Matrixin
MDTSVIMLELDVPGIYRERTMRLGRATTIAVAFILGTAAATAGYVFHVWGYNNWSIGDGVLGVCFENNSPVYTHRSILMSGLRQWGLAKNITLESNGRCDNDFSNVLVGWEGGDCTEPVITLAWTVPGNPTGLYSEAWINYNANCGPGKFWWGGTNPVPHGQFDAYSLATHEMGHAYGIAHTQGAAGEQIMEPSAACISNSNRFTSLSADDAEAIRWKYGGLGNTGAVFGLNAPCIN